MEIKVWVLIIIGVIVLALFYLCLESIYKLILRVTALENKLNMTISNMIKIQNNFTKLYDLTRQFQEVHNTIMNATKNSSVEEDS